MATATKEKLSTADLADIQQNCDVVSFRQEQLRVILNRVAACAASGQYEKGTVLSHVSFAITGATAEVCGTDGSRLVVFKDTVTATADAAFRFTVPAEWLYSLKPVKGKVESIDFAVDRRTKQVNAYKTLVKIVEGPKHNYAESFPRYQELFPRETTKTLIFRDARQVIEMCQAVRQVDGVCLNFDIKADAKDHLAAVTMSKHRWISFKGETKIVSDQDIDVSFSAKFLPDALYSADKSTVYSITAQGNGPLKPWLFSDKDDRITHLLMPVQCKK